MASLRRICREASLPEQQTCDELLKLLPRAEKFHRDAACPASAAWGRASAEWPELQSARRLVELCIVWKTAIWNGAFAVFARSDVPSGHSCWTSQLKPA